MTHIIADKLYLASARYATLQGHRPGSHAWWDCIRARNAEARAFFALTQLLKGEAGLKPRLTRSWDVV